ncbi:hypothetical protein AALP_AA3G025700 [Arabis alpina]|uniref:Uncharacterized protein n=1 Tax=Arabis alpina TaxID=50452 RepID=A0A087H6K3_ARAAL|nr:hypothetical protein AALP_AA3G025700 [Arabis alpina]
MDFDSLARRDLQFFCKRNKIPANMTNLAMADALKALEIVEGIDEFMNQSPISVAKNLPSAARTAARRKTTKDETQSSELVTRSCYVTSKSVAGEMEQENRNLNVLQNPSVAMKLEVTDMELEANVSKTPAARSTRRTQVPASSKKDESVQRVYSTRRSVKLLEEYMADLSLKTKENINEPKKKNDDLPAGSKIQAESDDKSEKTEEAEVISVRDLNDSLEKESKNDPDLDILYGDLGDITFFDANTTKEQLNGRESNTVPASDSFVLVEGQETSQEDDFVVVDHDASTTTNIVACNKESESEQMKNDSEPESEETEYETDPWEDDDSGVVDDESKVPASDNVSMGDSVPTVLIVDESEELDAEESEPEEEEICESDELIDDNESEVSQVSDMKKAAQASSSPLAEKEHGSDSDEWSDFEIGEIDENSFECEELVESESEAAPVSDKKKTPASPFEAESMALVTDNNKKKNKENVEEMVLDNNGESKAEAEAKKTKKQIEEERLNEVSMRQLTKMVKDLALKSKSRPQHKYL